MRFSAGDVDNALFIYALGVHPDHRRQLLGTLLKQHVLDQADALGLNAVVSQVHRRNGAMQELNSTLNVVTAGDPSNGDYLISIARTDSPPVRPAE